MRDAEVIATVSAKPITDVRLTLSSIKAERCVALYRAD